jgi:alkylation response protein AidB-like acyl-CoA dehydrogenase
MLDFKLSADQEQMVAVLTRSLEKEWGSTRLLQSSRSSHPQQSDVSRLGAMGWVGAGLPESCGGVGATQVEESIVACEAGRYLVSPDLLATQLAAHVAYSAGDLCAAQRFAEGAETAGFVLSGESRMEPGEEAESSLLDSGAATAYIRVDLSRAEVMNLDSRMPPTLAECVDGSMRLRRVPSSQVTARNGGADDDSSPRQHMSNLIAAMLAGNAEGSRDLAVEYAKTRTQFGRPIGSFQAIKHRCADMHVRARTAYAQAMHAAMAAAAEFPDAPRQSAAALLVSAEAAIRNAESSIQIHGGMGFSAECAAHLFLKRAHVLRIIGGEAVKPLPTLYEQLSRRGGRR